MDLFDFMRENTMDKESPLASRLRPVTLDEVVGQQHIIGKDKLLYRAIKADKLGSVIFYGPPGTGKTTLAKVIANTTSADFKQINATVAGKKDMEEIVKEAKDSLGMFGKKTILFVDEIHRFNKGQQDYLLPFVEDGTLTLIGATTENPYFEVNGALLSRSRVFELKPLEREDIRELIRRAVYDKDKGMGVYNAVIDEEAMNFLADVGNADPQALVVAVAAAQAAERIGLPEAQIILSQAVTYVATAPKSNAACNAVFDALEAVKSRKTMPVPVHFQDAHYKGAAKLGHGQGYLYAHDFPSHYVKQQYLPDGMEGSVFYQPTENGYERKIKEHMEFIRNEAEE